MPPGSRPMAQGPWARRHFWMYLCIYMYICVFIYVYLCIFVYLYVYLCRFVYLYVYFHIFSYISIHAMLCELHSLERWLQVSQGPGVATGFYEVVHLCSSLEPRVQKLQGIMAIYRRSCILNVHVCSCLLWFLGTSALQVPRKKMHLWSMRCENMV